MAFLGTSSLIPAPRASSRTKGRLPLLGQWAGEPQSGTRVGAEKQVTSRDVHVLVYEAAEPVSTQRSDGRARAWGSGAGGLALMQRSVRAVRVVVLDELAQQEAEVASTGDQEVVEAFAAQGADEAFGDGV